MLAPNVVPTIHKDALLGLTFVMDKVAYGKSLSISHWLCFGVHGSRESWSGLVWIGVDTY